MTVVAYNGVTNRAYKVRYQEVLREVRANVQTQYVAEGKWPFEDAVRQKLAVNDGTEAKRIVGSYFQQELSSHGISSQGTISFNYPCDAPQSDCPQINAQGNLTWTFLGSVVSDGAPKVDPGAASFITGSGSPSVVLTEQGKPVDFASFR